MNKYSKDWLNENGLEETPEHTPLPWHYAETDRSGYVQGKIIDQYGNRDPVCMASKEDALLIVQAVNNHSALFGALEMALGWMKSYKAYNNIQDSGPLSHSIAEVEQVIARAKEMP